METENKQQPDMRTKWERWHEYHHRNSRSGRIMGGLVIVAIGLVWLAKIMGAAIPEWVFSWPMIVIAFGVFIGAKHSFRGFSWLFFVAVGAVFLVAHVYPELQLGNYLWPVLIIIFGLMIMFKPKRNRARRWRRWDRKWDSYSQSNTSEHAQMRFGVGKDEPRDYVYEDYKEENAAAEGDDKLELVSVFGSIKKNVISKNFKGGEATCIFGGTEINLTQADINGTISLEITQLFGGCTLVVPSNWQVVSSEMVSVLGSIEDKRSGQKDIAITDKVLLLRGTSVFGGIEIRNY